MIGRLLRFTPIILAAMALATAYGALSYSVKDHIKVDDLRVSELKRDQANDRERIIRLEAVMQDIPDIKKDIRELLKRVR